MKKLRKKTNQKFIVIAVVLLLTISIGYAALSTTLSINGTANIASSSWLVYFTNVEIKAGSVTAEVAPSTSGTSTTTLTWGVTMDTPGQFYEYKVDVKNDGTIDSMIGTLSNTSLTTNQAKYLDYKVTYSDGAEIEQYDKLDAGETVKLKVRLEFKKTVNPEDLPEEGTSISLTYTSNYVQADSNAKDRNRIELPNIGDTVNYTTSMNGVTLNNWKVFYVDEEYTTIIYGDCLPNSAIDTTTAAFSNLSKRSTYEIWSIHNRIELLEAMQTKSNWNELLIGTISGMPINYSGTSDTNIWAMGSPSIDLFVNSWNTLYPEDKIYTAQTTSQMSDGLYGYYVGLSENPTTIYIDYQIMQTKEGYNNSLYFPYQNNVGNCYSYWIASPLAKYVGDVMVLGFGGNLSSTRYHDINSAFRPVVSLPTNIIQ